MQQALNNPIWQPITAASWRKRTQRGSALLIVLVFAAIVAIMLYRELPVAAFEAQRQKEELLISRGNEYKRGVKLFVRKIGRFPTSIDELENTNRMRFLRRRYVDPLTGKDDWRLIHAGPGGAIIDSKVQSASNSKNAKALGQGATFAGFNNSFSGDTTAAANSEPPSAALRQRAPATKNAASAASDPFALPPLPGDSANTDPSATQEVGSTPGSGNTNPQLVLDPTTGQLIPNSQGTGSGGQTATGQPAVNGIGPNGFGGQGTTGSAGIASVQDQLNNVNPHSAEQAPAQQTSAFGNTSTFGNQQNGAQGTSLTGNQGNGVISGAGGIAGVASNAPGTSIKTVNDQTKYKLWEFYYDLSKEQSAGATAAMGGLQNQNANGNANGGTTNGTTNGTQTNGFGFGQTQPSGQSPSGFGGSNNQQGSPPTPQPQGLTPPSQ